MVTTVGMLGCELTLYATSVSTVLTSIAAAVVLILRELRFRHPVEPPAVPTEDEAGPA